MPRLFDKFKRWIWNPLGHIFRFRAVLDTFGWWKPAAALISAFAASIWRYRTSPSAPFVVLAWLGTFAVVLLILQRMTRKIIVPRTLTNVPILALSYSAGIEHSPGSLMEVTNHGNATAFNIRISDLTSPRFKTKFEAVPQLGPGKTIELHPNVESVDGAFQPHKSALIYLLAGRSGVWPISVIFSDVQGNKYRRDAEIIYEWKTRMAKLFSKPSKDDLKAS